MRKKLSKQIINAIILLLVVNSIFLAQNKHLKTFYKLVDKDWIGHYVESEDSHFVHKINFEYILNGNVVRETKRVDELGFEMETYYYYDWEKNQISFFSHPNKEMNSKGNVQIDGSIFYIEGTNFFNSGTSKFKKKFEVTKHGILYDFFFRKKGDDWIRGHLIEYK